MRRLYQDFHMGHLAHKSASRALLAIALLAGGPGQALSQEPPVTPGTRVRLALKPDGDKVVGVYVGQSQDFVIMRLESGDTVSQAIALDRLAGMEIDRGRSRPVAKSALVGAAIAAATGGLVGLIVPPVCEGGSWCIGPRTKGEMVQSGLAAGAVVGALAGLVVGAIGHQRWEQAGISKLVGVEVRAGVGVGLRIPFRL
jgi:hypothetical protein